MVVTRKVPVAPMPPASRTNSSQPPPRAVKPKSTLSLSAEKDKEAAAKSAAATPKTQSKSKHRSRIHKVHPKQPSGGWLDRLVYLSLSLLVLYAFVKCPSDEALSSPVCRGLSQYRVHVLEPYVLPPIYRALEHPSVAPYVEKAQHIERTAVRPVLDKTAPYAAAAKRVAVSTFSKYVVPQYRKHVLPQWQKHVVPQWHKHAGPYISRATPYALRAQHTLERTAFVLHKTYSTRVAPFAKRVYAASKPHVVRGYRTAKPHVVRLYLLAVDKVGKAWYVYVDPHVVRIWAKVLELSGAGPVGSATEQPVPVPEATAASSDDATTAAVVRETAVEAAVTPVEVEASVTPSAVDVPTATPEVAPTETASSSVTPVVEASSIVEASSVAAPEPVVPVKATSSVAPPAETTPAAVLEDLAAESVLEDLAAASIAIQSAHGMESPIVEEILADAASAVEEPAPTSTPLSAVEEESPAAPAVVEEDDDADLFDFLDDLGLTPADSPSDSDIGDIVPDDDEDIELSRSEIHNLKVLEAEQQAAAKERRTKEERARLTAAMAASTERLNALAKTQNKALRKALVATRKKAVARLDDVRTLEGGAVKTVAKEGEKMLGGLEGYVRKELKSLAGKTPEDLDAADVKERTERFETVIGRVEDKLRESIGKAQNVLQTFHAEEKAQEVEEGLAIIKEVKNACSQAQGDVGMDLSWLADVTPMDWEVYHSLAKIGEDFQVEASDIQSGKHPRPPADPFLVRLEAAHDALTELVQELGGRIDSLRAEFAGAVNPAVADVPSSLALSEEEGEDEEEGEAEAAEPEVSILPIEPVAPAEPEIVDPAQVVIGKSTEQVVQAMRAAGEL
ncbi:hypothetical protein DFH06DRAFT_1188593 [Mycena polygramma]|nr:hypothetical protein DFH06DRAFT_1188593 [Mycena polygramma]